MEFDLLWTEPAMGTLADWERDLVTDLKMDVLLREMAKGDGHLYEECEKILTRVCTDREAILKRQAVLRDALDAHETFENLYRTAADVLAQAEKIGEADSPRYDKTIPVSQRIVTQAHMAEVFLRGLNEIGGILSSRIFQSEGMRLLQEKIARALEDGYAIRVEERIRELLYLEKVGGAELCVHMGRGLKMADAALYALVKDEHLSRSRQMREIKKRGKAVVFLDHIGLIQNAQEMTETSLRPVWALIHQFNQSMQAVCQKLRTQAGFYAGCVRLHKRLDALGVPLCFPELNDGSGEYRAAGLADAGLALLEGKAPVGNVVQGEGIRLWVVTGANQGGKTTFLRSVGLAQVMAQSGLFAAAHSLSCPVYSGLYTHFPNGEDKEMNSGLLEVELRKLDALIGTIRSGALLLMNESFATTTPGEAAFLSDQVTRALRESDITTFFVTHLFGFADALWQTKPEDVRFLRAPRETDGGRTYRLEEGAPSETSYGQDLYERTIQDNL